MNSNDYDIWKSGVDLCDAWWEFAVPEEQEEINSSPSAWKAFELSPEDAASLTPDAAAKSLQKSLSEALDINRERNSAEKRLKQLLLDALTNLELRAFGYETPARPSDKPQQIPSHLFENIEDINWGRSSLKALGIVFEKIRVSEAETTELATAKVKSLSDRPGRPTKETEILQVIEHLIKSGVDLNKILRKQAYDLIRATAVTEFKFNIEIGYSNPVLLKILNRKFGKRR